MAKKETQGSLASVQSFHGLGGLRSVVAVEIACAVEAVLDKLRGEK
jgi:hypothetical protein